MSLIPSLKELNINFEVTLYDNGSEQQVKQINSYLCEKYGLVYCQNSEVLEPSKDFDEREIRISTGWAKLARRLLQTQANTFLLIEDDWKCIRSIPLGLIRNFIKKYPNIGQVRLRHCLYDGSLTGYSTHNFVTGKPILFHSEHKEDSSRILQADMHWSNNPSIVKKPAIEVLAKGWKSELSMMKEFYKEFPSNAQLLPGIFNHIGEFRVRSDLIQKGIIKPKKSNVGSEQ